MKTQSQLQSEKNPSPNSSFPGTTRSSLLQRKCPCGGTPGVDGVCIECRNKRLQRRPPGQANLPEVPPIVNDVLQSPGETLDPTTRVSLAQRFGHDFSKVRVHADPQAAESARAINASARSTSHCSKLTEQS
jgi:hypothetical protein